MNILDNASTRIFDDQNSQLTPLAGLGLPNVFDAPQAFTGSGSAFNASGITLGWNYAGIGESDMFLGPGALSGGLNIYSLTASGSVNGAPLVSMNNTGTIQFNPVATPTDEGNLFVTRQANFTGGTAGYTNSGVRVNTYAGANNASYEWAITGVVYNSATGGQNVGGYFQGNRMTTTTGATWGGVCEVIEQVAIASPTTGLVGLEVDNRSNGTDANHVRIGIDVVCTRYNTSLANTEVAFGVRVQNNGDNAGTLIDTGFGFSSGLVGNVGFDASTAAWQQCAFKAAQGQSYAFDAAAANQILFNGTDIAYSVNGATVFSISQAGGISLNSGVTSLSGTFGTGTVTPVLSANKPGTSTGVGTWLSVMIDGNQYWLPVWGN